MRMRHSLCVQLQGLSPNDVRMTDDVRSVIEVINKLTEAVTLLTSDNTAQEIQAQNLQPS
jgi:hypothetical protein